MNSPGLSHEMKQTKAQLDRKRAVVELLTSPDAHMAKLAGTNVAPGAQAMLAYDKSGHAMLMAKGLPSAPEGHGLSTLVHQGQQENAGESVLLPTPQAMECLRIRFPTVAREAAVFAVTLEPKAGVQVPTGSIYLVSAS